MVNVDVCCLCVASQSRSLCSSPLPDPSPPLTSSSSSSPSDWGLQNRVPSPARGDRDPTLNHTLPLKPLLEDQHDKLM